MGASLKNDSAYGVAEETDTIADINFAPGIVLQQMFSQM